MKLQGFPQRYKDAPPCTGDGWHKHYQQAEETIKAGGILVFYGGHGTGKTRMAYELAKQVKPPSGTYLLGSIPMDRPSIYTTAVALFMNLRDTYRSDSEISEKKLVAELSGAALLVIDEMQERAETRFEDQKLTAIIDARYMEGNGGRPTIIISNQSRQQLAKTLSPAVIDRIRENGKGFHFNWTSFRKRITI
jgi:DNA replication protein DnaC